MDLHEYQEFVEQLASPRSVSDEESRFLTAVAGLAGEVGEFADHVKKAIFHGGGLQRDHLKDELGDILWYCAFAANALEVSLDSVIAANVAKLQHRYRSGVFKIEEFLAKEAAKCPATP